MLYTNIIWLEELSFKKNFQLIDFLGWKKLLKVTSKIIYKIRDLE